MIITRIDWPGRHAAITASGTVGGPAGRPGPPGPGRRAPSQRLSLSGWHGRYSGYCESFVTQFQRLLEVPKILFNDSQAHHHASDVLKLEA